MKVYLATIEQNEWNLLEKATYEELARRDVRGEHIPVNLPSAADVIVFVDLHQQPHDPDLKGLRSHKLVEKYRERIRVVDVRDRPHWTFPGVYVSWTRGRRGSAMVEGGCYPSLLTPSAPSHDEPDLLFSFAGARTHPVRDDLFTLQHPRAVLHDTTARSPFASAHAEIASQDQARYRELMARSKFVLCPRGHGPATFRLFETMSAGRVPVVLSDRWMPPSDVRWSDASVQIPERRAGDVISILEGLEGNWPALARESERVWQSRFAPDVRWHYLMEALGRPRGRLRMPSLQYEPIRRRALKVLRR